MNYSSEMRDAKIKMENRQVDLDLETIIIYDSFWEMLEETSDNYLIKSFWFKQNFSESMTDRVLMTTYH